MFYNVLCSSLLTLELPPQRRGWGGRGGGGGGRGGDVLWGATDRDGRGSPGAGDGEDTEAVEWHPNQPLYHPSIHSHPILCLACALWSLSVSPPDSA